MKRSILAIAMLCVGMFAVSAQAADNTVPEGVFMKRQAVDQQLARDFLIGAKVYDGNKKIIGDVEDLILDELNTVEGVIIGVGGVLGIGEKRIGVRYTALQIEVRDGKQVIVLKQATKSVLKSLEPYVRSRPPKSFFDSAMEKAKELADKTSDTTSDAYKKAKEKATPALEQAKQKAGEAYQAAKEKVKEAVEKAKEATQ